MSARYLTTTIPYVNADAHIGHALEFVQADCVARAARLQGDDVFFNIGTDEHGAKVYTKAKEAGQEPQAYVDEFAVRWQKFADALDISYDFFSRTTSDTHKAAAQEFWRRCAAAGDIYKALYQIKYCVGCELEKTDSELVNGRCPIHPNLTIEIREEENYYFRLSKYGDALLKLYADTPDFLMPEEHKRAMIALINAGLKDFSISRVAVKMPWGVLVPDDDAHVMYVWFDALVNYISAIGWPENEETFKKWWPVTQLAGKDQVRQQAVMWQAMLLSVGLPFSKQIFIHGFITSNGQKMSKSLGNVIDPVAVIEKYGTDAVRYILLRHVSPTQDSDLTLEAIHDHYTANLTNGLGNLVARVMQLAETYLSAPVAASSAASEPISDFKFNEAMDAVWARVSAADERITRERPFVVVKENPEEGKHVIAELVQELYRIGTSLRPYMPATAEKIIQAVKENKKPENLFPRL
ncbi:MAG: methionine--tRNA ligase [Candidatus Paceibacterota bacterium]|jgi:methionyl-tRNA synthetase